MAKLTLIERETIVLFNEAEDTATVYTCTKSIINKCQAAGYKVLNKDRCGGFLFECPKSCISFRSVPKEGRKKRALSEEHKEKLRKARVKSDAV